MPTVTVTVTDASGNVSAPASASWTVGGGAPLKVIGMSAPDAEWSQRLSEVGSNGIRARRIFGDLTAAGNDRASIITAAHAANMMPVMSYKVPSVANAITGSYDAWAQTAATYLNSFNKPTAVTIWHEPRGDMTPAQFVQLHTRLMPIFAAKPNLTVGPVLNGFLLDTANGRTEFAQYTSPALFGIWDWFGMDVYQTGDAASPGPIGPGDRIQPCVDFLTGLGQTGFPILIGEFNAFSAANITEAMNEILDEPSVQTALLFNSSTGAKGVVLTGSMLTAFQTGKADPRVLQ